MKVLRIFSVFRQTVSSSLILCGIFSGRRCLHRNMRLILLPVGLSRYFVESLFWGQWKKASTTVHQNTIFFRLNNREQYFLWKQCSQVFFFHQKKLFSAGSPVLAISETLFFLFCPPARLGQLTNLRNVDTKNIKILNCSLTQGVSTALLAWVWTLTSASPHREASVGVV